MSPFLPFFQGATPRRQKLTRHPLVSGWARWPARGDGRVRCSTPPDEPAGLSCRRYGCDAAHAGHVKERHPAAEIVSGDADHRRLTYSGLPVARVPLPLRRTAWAWPNGRPEGRRHVPCAGGGPLGQRARALHDDEGAGQAGPPGWTVARSGPSGGLAGRCAGRT